MGTLRNWSIWIGGGLLVGMAAIVLDYAVLNGWDVGAIGRDLQWVVAPLVGDGRVTNWHVGLVYFLVALVIGVVYVVVGRGRREDLFTDGSSEDRSKKKNYRSDRVENLHWTWSWGLYGNVINLTPDCLECGTAIEIEKEGEGHCVAGCRACGYEKRWAQSRYELVRGVRAEINRRVEDGEWEIDQSGEGTESPT